MKKSAQKLLLNYLKKHKLMTLAVVAGKKPWVATVYYVADDDLNLYCLTGPQTEHAQAATKNKNVACNIADSHQKVTDQKVGMQIQGTISRVQGFKTIKWMLKMWHQVNPGKETILNLENMRKKAVSARVYKITPQKIRFFNEKLYKEDEYETFYL